MSKQATLHQNLEVKSVVLSKEDPSVMIVEGYASFYRHSNGELQVDRDNELVNTDNLSIDDYEANPVICWNHDWSTVVGKATRLQKDRNGLNVTVEVYKLTGLEHIFEGVQKGLIKAFSIGFIPEGYKWYDDELLEIESASLIEISLVGVPANQQAIFQVVGEKSPKVLVEKKTIARQNDLDCDGINCLVKDTKKEKSMEEVNTAPAEKETTTENVETPPEVQNEEAAKDEDPSAVVPTEEDNTEDPVITPTPEVVNTEEAPKTESAAVNLDPKVIAQAMLEAQQEATRIAEKEKEDAKIAAETAENDKVSNAHKYLAEQYDKIKDTNANDLDTDDVEDLYELASNITELINDKVKEALAPKQ